MSALVASFYRFVAIDDPASLHDRILEACRAYGVRGTILIAEEGVNGSVAGDASGVRAVLDSLREQPGLEDLRVREALADRVPFQRIKVRVRSEIVTFRQADSDPAERVGTYVSPDRWNELIGRAGVALIDTRNAFEVGMGTFEGSIDPRTDSFSDFATWVAEQEGIDQDTPVAMFCTGGIRCEKATSFLLAKGFREVYHLEGGILGYLDAVPESESLWKGECFVFDERIALGHSS